RPAAPGDDGGKHGGGNARERRARRNAPRDERDDESAREPEDHAIELLRPLGVPVARCCGAARFARGGFGLLFWFVKRHGLRRPRWLRALPSLSLGGSK